MTRLRDMHFNLAHFTFNHRPRPADKTALIVDTAAGADVYTYQTLEAWVRSVATGLNQTGLQPGDRVLMRLANSVHFPIAYLGAICAGLVPVVTSPKLTTRELENVIRITKPQALIVDAELTLEGNFPGPTILATQLTKWRDLPPSDYLMGDAERPAYIVMTSGTGASPKAVVHAHRAITARAMMWRDWEDLQPTDCLFHAGAMNWTYTLGTGLLDPWCVGATALVAPVANDPQDLAATARRHKATIFAASPGIFRRLLRSPADFGTQLRHALSAGEKLPAPTRVGWHNMTGTMIFEAYGMSECSTFVSAAPNRPAPNGSLGWPQTGRRVAIRNPDGPTPQGDTGHISIPADDPGLMLGYLGRDGTLSMPLTNGFFETSDLGHMGPDGALFFAGRADDVINAGGIRVSPMEIESVMSEADGVTDCAAIEVALPDNKSVIGLYYTGQDVNQSSLEAHAAANLADYKRPRVYFQIDQMPRGANNKLLRRALRARHTHDQVPHDQSKT